MKLTNRKIDRMIARTPADTELSDEFKNRVQQLMKNLVENPAYPFPSRKKPARAAAAVLCVLLLSTVSVGAAIGKYQERMEAMPDSEIKKNVSELEESYRHADFFSRELSEQEKEQFRKLAAEYEQGLRFPEGVLFTAASAADIRMGSVGFAVEESTFILPDEPLSEEEMLQIIDFHFKRDFSLDKMNAANNAASQIQIDEVTEDKAVQIARELVKSVLDLDLAGYETVITNPDGDIKIEFLQNERSYKVLVNKKTGRVTEFEFDRDRMQNTDVAVDEPLYIEKYKEITEFLVNQIGVTEPFESAFCTYGENEESKTLYGCVSYFFRVNESYYIIRFDAEEKQLLEMDIAEMNKFNSSYEINIEQAAKAGIQNKRIDFITSNTKENQEELE